MKLNFRQVHLDFHTSECIDGIGARFSKEQFQAMLKKGHVNSITVFSKCHHGYAYHPSDANEMHPGLKFDLLKAQIEAAHEIGVKTPVYISAGYDEKLVKTHSHWLRVRKDGNGSPLDARYHEFCLNTDYLEYLLAQIKEVCERYDADGIFLDIVGEKDCYCPTCLAKMKERGINPYNEDEVELYGKEIYANYTKRVRETIDAVKPGLPVFHNGGHIAAGRRDLAFYNTHLEMESLPTGGWGYDHFPMSAAYGRVLGAEFLGMTGKFHTTWGEFGGFKHKNALRYEAALSIANGAKCSIGDQLHPNGEMNETTYTLIGEAYAEVEAKEAWCDDVEAVADVGLLSVEAITGERNNASNVGAMRMLLEGKYLFDVIDTECDFSKYKVIVLPDVIVPDGKLASKLSEFVNGGGKLLASGESCLDVDKGGFCFDFGCEFSGVSDYCPAYINPTVPLKNTPQGTYVIYKKGFVVKRAGDGEELATREQPYFNRTVEHFCSHRHAPNSGVIEGSAVTVGRHGAYIGWYIFREYREVGSLILREMFTATLDRLLGNEKSLETSLPAQGVTTLMDQKKENRLVNHLLYASPVKRGRDIEIIEDIIPIYSVDVTLRTDKNIKRVYLAPQMTEIPFEKSGNEIRYTVERLENHQMVVLDY